MLQAHRGRGIEAGHFDLVVQHLVDTLTAAGVPGSITEQIISALAPLASEIVSPGAAHAM